MTTELTTNTGGALAALAGLETTGFEGLEDVSVRSFLQLANHANHLKWCEGIKFGDIYNTLTGDIYETVMFIPCAVDRHATEYTDDNEFVGRHELDGDVYQKAIAGAEHDDKGRIDYKTVCTSAGNKVTASHDVYALVSPDDGNSWFEAVIPMQSTKIAPYQRFFKTLEMRHVMTPDGPREPKLFECLCKLGVKGEKKGSNHYHNYTFSFIGHLGDENLAGDVASYVISSTKTIAEKKANAGI